MSWNNIKIDKADKVFSNYVRTLHNWTCEKCGKRCKINGEHIAKLEASHYFGRRCESVRFDEENVRALCAGCHRRMGGYKKAQDGEYDLWMKELLGQDRYDRLVIRAHTTGKRDRQMAFIYWSAMLKDLEGKQDLSELNNEGDMV